MSTTNFFSNGGTKVFKIPWTKPKTDYTAPKPFIPLQCEIDQLQAECTLEERVFIQVAADTGARASELIKIEWTDVDFRAKTIYINKPGKGSDSRIVKVTDKTLAYINLLPKRHGKYLFNPNHASLRPGIDRAKERLAEKTGNLRFLKIHMHTFRHFKGTMHYAKTRDILSTQSILGHKNIQSTMIYTHLIDFAEEEYDVQRPQTRQEEDALLSHGYEYVRFDERDHCPIYRRRR